MGSMGEELRQIARANRRLRNERHLQKLREDQELELALTERPDGEFLLAIWENPADSHLRLVYADWLEDQGQLGQATYIRLGSRIEALPQDDPQRAELMRDRAKLRANSVGVASEEGELLEPRWLELWSRLRRSPPEMIDGRRTYS